MYFSFFGLVEYYTKGLYEFNGYIYTVSETNTVSNKLWTLIIRGIQLNKRDRASVTPCTCICIYKMSPNCSVENNILNSEVIV